jgi:hypothetical protein
MAFCGHLKQSTSVTIIIGPFVDEDDGKTAETGLTITQADVRLSKNGGNMAQKNDANAATHDEIGNYACQLDTTDTNTLGILTVMVHESGALPIKQEYQIVTANWYDTMCSTDQLDVNVTNIEGSDATDQIRDAIVDDATRIDASALNTLSGHAPDNTIADVDDVSAITPPTVDQIWDEVMDTNAPANCRTGRHYMNVIASGMAGKDAGTGDWSARDLGNTKTRIQGTLDSDGKRASIDVLDGT